MCELHKAVLVCQLGCTLNSVSYKLYYFFQGLTVRCIENITLPENW